VVAAEDGVVDDNLGIRPVEDDRADARAVDQLGREQVDGSRRPAFRLIGRTMSTSSAGDIDPNWVASSSTLGSASYTPFALVAYTSRSASTDSAKAAATASVVCPGVTPPITDTPAAEGGGGPRRTRRRRKVRAAGERGDKQAGVEPGRPDAQLVEFDLVGAQFARRLDVLARDAAPPTTTPTSQPSAASRSIASAYAATRSGSRSGASTLPPIETTTLITVEYPCRGLKDYQADRRRQRCRRTFVPTQAGQLEQRWLIPTAPGNA